MTLKSEQRELIKQFILDQVSEHPKDIARVVSTIFNVSRQTGNNYLNGLIVNGLLEKTGQTRNIKYVLKKRDLLSCRLQLIDSLPYGIEFTLKLLLIFFQRFQIRPF